MSINLVYSKQKNRDKCKNCNQKLKSAIFFSHGINYTLCENCNHLNGCNEDSKEFADFLYSSDDGGNYSKPYINDFKSRVEDIYIPKVEFLSSVIKDELNILDIGCGAGYFLRACELRDIAATGYDPSRQLVNLGKKLLKKNQIFYVDSDSTYKKILESDCNVLSMIGVLEHLDEPHKILDAYIKSKVKYLYISVPLLSLSVFIENSFKNVFPRQLSDGHTHLYTKESLDFLVEKYKLKILGEWWFGTDFADLYRSLLSSANCNINEFKPLLDKYLLSIINELQKTLDNNKICSEVHMVFEKK